jgi:hypothetical protein
MMPRCRWFVNEAHRANESLTLTGGPPRVGVWGQGMEERQRHGIRAGDD